MIACACRFGPHKTLGFVEYLYKSILTTFNYMSLWTSENIEKEIPFAILLSVFIVVLFCCFIKVWWLCTTDVVCVITYIVGPLFPILQTLCQKQL